MAEICESSNVLIILRVVKSLIGIVRVIVPLILIVIAIIQIVSAITKDKVDSITGAFQMILNKLVAAFIILIIPTIVTGIYNVFNTSNYSILDCLALSTPEGIQNAYVMEANSLINNVASSLDKSDYDRALNVISKISDESKRNELTTALEKYEKYVDLKNTLVIAKSEKVDEDRLKELQEMVNKLDSNDPYKNDLLSILNTITIWTPFNIYDEYDVPPRKQGTPIDVPEGYKTEVYNGITFYVYMPPDATTNMPILLWLHGDTPQVEWLIYIRIKQTAVQVGYPVIMIQPFIPNMGISPKTWGDGDIMPTMKEYVDKICEKYQCDKENINIGGHSQGAVGTWTMVSRYPNYFHAAAPVSCCSFGNLVPSNFAGVKVWAVRGSGKGEGDNNDDLYSCMEGDVNAVKTYAKSTQYFILPNTTHGEATNELQDSKDFIIYMFTG